MFTAAEASSGDRWQEVSTTAERDGDGWTLCARGHRHWGLHGASGLLAVHHAADGTPYVLLQKRALWSHHGGTWGLPGGATDSHEDAITGALREAWEETALDTGALRVCGVYVDDHGGWAYQTVIAQAASLLEASQRAALLPDTPAALAALVAVHCGELDVAKSVLERALRVGLGGRGAVTRHRLLLGYEGQAAGVSTDVVAGAVLDAVEAGR